MARSICNGDNCLLLFHEKWLILFSLFIMLRFVYLGKIVQKTWLIWLIGVSGGALALSGFISQLSGYA